MLHWLYWDELGRPGLYWSGLYWTGPYLIFVIFFTQAKFLYWIVLGCTGIYLAILGYTWLEWAMTAVLDCAGLY